MAIANVVTRVGPSVSAAAKIAYVITHGLGNYGSIGPTPPPQGSVLIHHKRRGQAGAVQRGVGGAIGGLVQ